MPSDLNPSIKKSIKLYTMAWNVLSLALRLLFSLILFYFFIVILMQEKIIDSIYEFWKLVILFQTISTVIAPKMYSSTSFATHYISNLYWIFWRLEIFIWFCVRNQMENNIYCCIWYSASNILGFHFTYFNSFNHPVR